MSLETPNIDQMVSIKKKSNLIIPILWLILFAALFFISAFLYLLFQLLYTKIIYPSPTMFDYIEINSLIKEISYSPTHNAFIYLIQTLTIIPFVLLASNSGDKWYNTLAIKKFSIYKMVLFFGIFLFYLVLEMFISSYLKLDMGRFLESFYGSKNLPFLLSTFILAPILEESIFRGYIFSLLRKSIIGRWGTIVVITVLFALIHSGQYPVIVLFILVVLSFIITVTREFTGSLLPCIIIHAVNNLIASVYVLFICQPTL